MTRARLAPAAARERVVVAARQPEDSKYLSFGIRVRRAGAHLFTYAPEPYRGATLDNGCGVWKCESAGGAGGGSAAGGRACGAREPRGVVRPVPRDHARTKGC